MIGTIKNRIDAAAKKNGRTQSQEAEHRIERSFEDEDILPRVLALAYGRELAGLLIALGSTMQTAGRYSAYAEGGLDAIETWHESPRAREAAASALSGFAEKVRSGSWAKHLTRKGRQR